MADMRTCIGSAKFGIEAHEAPVEDFPVQASQKDGRGRICRPHWTQYTRALRTAANDGTAAKATREATVQSKAAASVATKRAARVAKGAALQSETALQADAAGRTAANHARTKSDADVQSKAAASVATKRAARVAVGVESDAEVQRKLLAKVRTNGGSIPAA